MTKVRIDKFLKLRAELYADVLKELFSPIIPLELKWEAMAELEKNNTIGVFLKDNYPEYYIGDTVFRKDDYKVFQLMEDVKSGVRTEEFRNLIKNF